MSIIVLNIVFNPGGPSRTSLKRKDRGFRVALLYKLSLEDKDRLEND
jgi:hypothetical protein